MEGHHTAGKFEIYKDQSGKFRFRLKAANGQIVAQSQSYATGDGAAAGAISVMQALHEAMPAKYQAMVTLAIGTGMRQGECYGLTIDRVDFMRRTLRVDRQLVKVTRRAPFFAPQDAGQRQDHCSHRSWSTHFRPTSQSATRTSLACCLRWTICRCAGRPSSSASGDRRDRAPRGGGL